VALRIVDVSRFPLRRWRSTSWQLADPPNDTSRRETAANNWQHRVLVNIDASPPALSRLRLQRCALTRRVLALACQFMHSLRIGTGFAQYCFPSTVTQLQAGWAHFVVAFIKTPISNTPKSFTILESVCHSSFVPPAYNNCSALWTMLLRVSDQTETASGWVAVTGRGRFALLPRRSP